MRQEVEVIVLELAGRVAHFDHLHAKASEVHVRQSPCC